MSDSPRWVLPWYVVSDLVCVTGSVVRKKDSGSATVAANFFEALLDVDVDVDRLVQPGSRQATPLMPEVLRPLVAASKRRCYPWPEDWPNDLRVYFRQMPHPGEFILGPTRLVLPWPTKEQGTAAAKLADLLKDHCKDPVPVRERTGTSSDYDLDPETDFYANRLMNALDHIVRDGTPTGSDARDDVNRELDQPSEPVRLPQSLKMPYDRTRPTDATALVGFADYVRIDVGTQQEICPDTRQSFRIWDCGAWP